MSANVLAPVFPVWGWRWPASVFSMEQHCHQVAIVCYSMIKLICNETEVQKLMVL